MMIIPRKEREDLKSCRGWIFVFGRRKTGKSFLVKNFADWDEYFFVKRDRTLLSEKEGNVSYETFLNIVKRELSQNRTIVVDEFHRLGDDFLDFVHSIKRSGRLILVSSTLFLSKKLLGEKSPILGLFSELPIRIISLADTLGVLAKMRLTKKELVENAILLREPISINSFDENKNSRDLFSKVILSNLRAIPSLIGEIFLEEEKTLSAVYEGILRSIANGNTTSTGIAGYLFSRKLIANNDASIVQQYLNNLTSLGIIKKIGVYNKNKFIYKHSSPLTMLFYYADEKYNISERDVNEEEIRRIAQEIIPRIVEDNIREFLAQKFGFSESIMEFREYDIDCCLLKFNKPSVVVEVKWKEKVRDDEIRKAEANLNKIKANKRYLFVQNKQKIPKSNFSIDIADINDFL